MCVRWKGFRRLCEVQLGFCDNAARRRWDPRPCLGKNDLFGLLSLGAFFARIISPLIFLHQWTRLKHAEKDGEKHTGANVAQQSPAAGARRA